MHHPKRLRKWSSLNFEARGISNIQAHAGVRATLNDARGLAKASGGVRK
jgi:hypothetical protein